MPRSYSTDMRERVIARVESGASRREGAEHYEVDLGKCFRETGRCSAKPRGGSTSEDEPDLRLDEVVSVMRKHKVLGSRTAVWRFFQRHKITSKKSAARGRSRNARMSRGRGGAGCEKQGMFDPARLVFIDETSANTKMVRLYGRALAESDWWARGHGRPSLS